MILRTRGCACGTVIFNTTLVFRISYTIPFNFIHSASGGIIQDTVTIQHVSSQAYFITSLYFPFLLLTFSETSFSSLPGQTVGILGLSEESCNPTCVPPVYHSILQSVNPSCTFLEIHFLKLDKKEDMKVSLCFGKTVGKLGFGDTSTALNVSSFSFTFIVGFSLY